MPEPPLKVDLPGQVAYEEDCLLQTLTLFDVKQINNAGIADDLKLVTEVIGRRCSLPVNDLLWPDFWFLLHWQRLQSYSLFRIHTTYKCVGCGEKNTLPEEKSLDFEVLRSDYRHGRDIHFPTGTKKLRLSMVRDVLELDRMARKKTDSIEMEMTRLAMMMEPNGGSLEERVEEVRGMTADDGIVFDIFEADHVFGVKRVTEVECPHCDKKQGVGSGDSAARFLAADSVPDALRAGIYTGYPTKPVTR